jgi:hypothetical protein
MGFQRLTEIASKDDNKEKVRQVTEMLNHGYFDYDEFNLFGTGWMQEEQRITPMKQAEAEEFRTFIKETPFRTIAKEFLAQSGTTGIAGAAYLVPTKIYSTMFDSAVEKDVVADISIAMIPAESIGGSTMNVDIAIDDSYNVFKQQSGAKAPMQAIQTTQATLDFKHWFGINFTIGNDLIEDSHFDIMDMHIRNAGREIGEFASNEALGVLKLGADGDGTLNSSATGNADETKFQGGATSDVLEAINDNSADGFISDTIVLTHQALMHSVLTTMGLAYHESTVYDEFLHGKWPASIGPLNAVYSDCDTLTNSKAQTDCVTIVFDKDYALLSGRKRWLRMENYSEPLRDLSGAVVTCRQDSVTVYNDSIYTLTET